MKFCNNERARWAPPPSLVSQFAVNRHTCYGLHRRCLPLHLLAACIDRGPIATPITGAPGASAARPASINPAGPIRDVLASNETTPNTIHQLAHKAFFPAGLAKHAFIQQSAASSQRLLKNRISRR